jgi:ADP-heptose:LPS heptosyltransferase
MERFANQPLGSEPRILVLGTAKLGNLVVLMPLLRALKRRHPQGQVLYRGSERTRELEDPCPWIDQRFGASEQLPRAVDLLINADAHNPSSAALVQQLAPRFVVGPAMGLADGEHPLQQLAVDPAWADPYLAKRYAGWLTTASIRDLHCRVCWLNPGDVETVELPEEQPCLPIPPVLLSVNGERRAKLWPVEHWLELLALLEQRLGRPANHVGLVGAAPSAQGPWVETRLLEAGLIDLRGKLSLPQLVGAYRQCALAIGVDSGPLHLAAAAGCPTVAIFGTDTTGIGASPQRLWAPQQPWVKLTSSPVRCNGCLEAGYRNDGCLLPQHRCMETILPQQVMELAEGLLAP